jgi:hypothetical protein
MTSVDAAKSRLKCINLEPVIYTETNVLRFRFGYEKHEKLNAISKAFYKTGK